MVVELFVTFDAVRTTIEPVRLGAIPALTSRQIQLRPIANYRMSDVGYSTKSGSVEQPSAGLLSTNSKRPDAVRPTA